MCRTARLGTLGFPALCFFSAGSSRSSSSSLEKPMLGELQVKLGGARGGNNGGCGASVINGFGGNGMCSSKPDGAGWKSGNCNCGAHSACAT
eukprot:6122772-Pyramimonas_sp.AAC.1